MSCCAGSKNEERAEPTRVRGCTDVFWLCFFIAFWFLMILIAAFAIVYGNPLRLINGYDSFGNTCGMKNNPKFGSMELSGQDTSDKPYLFFLDINNVTQSLKICVKQCPDRILRTMEDICKFYKETGSQLCHDRPGGDFSACNSESSIFKNGSCPERPVYPSIPVLNRCIPKAVKEVSETIISNLYGLINSWDVIEQVLGDLCKTWKQILALSFVACVLSLFVITIFHLLASVVTWIIIVLVSIASTAGTILLWMTYVDIKKTLDKTDPNQLLEEAVRNERAFLAFSIIATIITIILLFLSCILRKRISFMAALFKESAKCLRELPGLFFQPILTFISLILFFAFWIFVILCLATANYPETKSVQMYKNTIFDPVNLSSVGENAPLIEEKKMIDFSLDSFKTFTLVEYVDATWVKYMWWVYLIGLIWTSEFIVGCQDMVISGSVAHWYFRDKNGSSFPVCSSIGHLVCYHMGSVACGSLLITIFKLPRLILTYLYAKFEKTKETSPCAQCGLKFCICCFYCLEKFIRYMNHNAYTVVAIEGTHFCNAARIAYATLVSNALQIAVINGFGDFILFLGKCFVTAATGSIALLFMREDPELHFYAIPIFVICVFSFFIAHCIISLYETVIDTLFLCVCEDKNLNGENGKWRQSALAQIGASSSNANGQQSHEMTPINE
ncbi:PREDICTED: CTL-like protein 1 [Cyphomyrmex costatus]|uniref:Choline transporter-like protein n=1 Tax=Cyphomyrmex costatus TaxID=456900 RepID=A0A195CTF2_9HYME|nr:PREDICTED: CTL-like protein 1 [Cyphomyrmex costatus]KYN03777.1 CTL-like protein 1 [Cyphomyrmex costatus]